MSVIAIDWHIITETGLLRTHVNGLSQFIVPGIRIASTAALIGGLSGKYNITQLIIHNLALDRTDGLKVKECVSVSSIIESI